ncbi:MAG: ABC transporter ATP-binding protein [Bacilli bacterium]|nr:ABC transporter ATP-binding protein [Bacilli bacterium]
MKETFANLKKVYKFGIKYKKNLIMFSLMSLTFIIINIFLPIIGANQLIYLADNLYIQLLGASMIIFVVEIIAAINHLILRKNTQVFFRGTTKNIQLATAREILKIELTDIDSQTSGTFIQRVGSDTSEMPLIFTRGMGFLTSILTDIGIFVAIYIINKPVCLFYLISSAILTAIHLFKVRNVNEKDKIYRKQREKTSGLVGELVRGIRDIKMLHAKDSFLTEVEGNIDELTQSQFDMRNVEMAYNCVASIVSAAVQFLLIVILVIFLLKNKITLASAIVLYNYRTRVLSNLIHNVGYLLTEVKGFNLSCNRVFSVLGNNEFKKETFGTKHLDKVEGNFEFKDVYFSYGSNEVLKGLNFKIKANETVAFVGKSGAGKTTIFSLLCKLYDINKGQILLDGIDIKELDEYSIRNNITIISQNPYIFNMSIKDNLRLVKENLTDKEMKEACRLACLSEFIEALPDKYDTIVGEGGVTLSGGQRQRLAIARAFVQDTEIILFDEATSALDNETQTLIKEAINNLKTKYTILIIAHRLSTIVDSDRIMLIEDGKITSKGKHSTLLKKSKTYKKLYENELKEQE